MDDAIKALQELFQLQPELEEVALRLDAHDLWRVDLTLPKGTPRRISIMHTPACESPAEALVHARTLLSRRADLIQ